MNNKIKKCKIIIENYFINDRFFIFIKIQLFLFEK